jgi:hypothetical protein
MRDSELNVEWLERFKKAYRFGEITRKSDPSSLEDFFCAIHSTISLTICPPTPDEVDAVSSEMLAKAILTPLKTAAIHVRLATGSDLQTAASMVSRTFGTLPSRSNSRIQDCYAPNAFDHLLLSLNNGTSPWWSCDSRHQEIPLISQQGECESIPLSFVSGVKVDSLFPRIRDAKLIMVFPVDRNPTPIDTVGFYSAGAVLEKILEDRLNDYIRYELGSSYGISVQSISFPDSVHLEEIVVSLDFDPTKADQIVEEVLSVCELLAHQEPTQEEFERALAQIRVAVNDAHSLTPQKVLKLASQVFRREKMSYTRILPE